LPTNKRGMYRTKHLTEMSGEAEFTVSAADCHACPASPFHKEAM
jgi:hypothetical protein